MARRILDRFPGVNAATLNAFEIAAIVYDEGVSIDHLTSFLADEIAAGGHRIGGVLRLPAIDEEAAGETFVDLVSGDSWYLPAARHGAATDDTPEIAAMARRIKGCVKAGADLAFVPSFGAREIAGNGFSDAFGAVAAFGIPVLTTVGRDDVGAWLEFTGGIGTLLACRLRVVRAWWQETDVRRRRILARRSREAAAGGADIIPLRPTFA